MKNKLQTFLGVMSGTSLDGLDLALCNFEPENKATNFNLICAETIPYQLELTNQLKRIHLANAESFVKLDVDFGKFIGQQINFFLNKYAETADYIATHGHTIFHNPLHGYSTQIGNANQICASTGINTIYDFRSLDVAKGGQGAPLVPIGDRDLFFKYQACLNLGGIANISFTKNNITTAFDICFVNMLLNYLSVKINKPFDNNGDIAKQGEVNDILLNQLLNLDFKFASLGFELFERHLLPLISQSNQSISNLLATACEYVAIKIATVLNNNQLTEVLITGGGSNNTFLIDRIRKTSNSSIIIPDNTIINFKEAIIFAYLGYLRVNNKINCLASVTGASSDSVGGSVILAHVKCIKK